MSWESKTDYCSLAVANKIIIKASTENRSGQYLEKPGQHGAIVATKAFAALAAPSCEYTIKAPHAFDDGDIVLGTITAVDGEKFALASVHYENGADAEPGFSATAQQVEDDATTELSNTFSVPAFDVSPDECAAVIMSSFSLSGENCELVKVAMDASCQVKPHTVKGVPVSSDVTMGHVQIQLTVNQYGTATPVLTPASGWDVSQRLTCSDPDADFPVWTATVSKPLEKTCVALQTQDASPSEQT